RKNTQEKTRRQPVTSRPDSSLRAALVQCTRYDESERLAPAGAWAVPTLEAPTELGPGLLAGDALRRRPPLEAHTEVDAIADVHASAHASGKHRTVGSFRGRLAVDVYQVRVREGTVQEVPVARLERADPLDIR